MSYTYDVTFQHAEGEGNTTYQTGKPIQTIEDILTLIETIKRKHNVKADVVVWNEIKPKKEKMQ